MNTNKINDNFAVFILTHGRHDNLITMKTLQSCGYDGPLYLIVDDQDKTLPEYIAKYGDKVQVFNKKAIAEKTDSANNTGEMRSILFARNASFDIAKKLGFEYFIQLDDDYTSFDFRIDTNSKENRGDIKKIKNLNNVFNNLIAYYKSSNFTSIAFAQGGDFIGGINNGKGSYRFSKRKCMNTFICSVSRKFQFIGVLNDDVNTYVSLGSRGHLFLTIPFVSITQKGTQQQKKGLTDMYLRFGTYCKSFTTTIIQPSSASVSMLNSNNPRIHHSINWKTTVPQIISEKHKK